MHFWIFSIRRIRERICRFLQDTCRIDYINGIDTLPPPLSKEEEAAVFAALEAGDSNARETLIVHNLRLVVYIARKFALLESVIMKVLGFLFTYFRLSSHLNRRRSASAWVSLLLKGWSALSQIKYSC